MKKLFLTWSAASLLVLFYAACGDDVIHVHNDEYAIVDSLDSLDCNSGNEGEMALVKSTGVLYACTDGEWSVVNASEAVDLRCKSEPLKDSTGYKIICDGKTIGTVQNGTDGQAGQKGADGKAGQKGADGKAGQNAKEVNVDSVSKAVSKKVTDSVIDTLTQVLVDSLSCHVDSSWTDTKESLINVQISCGSASSIIQLPTLVPNKNLTKHYKKTVMVRFPYFYGESLLGLDNTAELIVMEVDSNFERTGKNFVSELYLSKQTKLTMYQNPNLNIMGGFVNFLVNDVDVTNMMNSYAQFRVRINGSTGSGEESEMLGSGGISEVVYMAFVDMDDRDTIVVDFVSDYKAARIETLMKKKGTDFAKASKQANDEITEALGLGKDFHAVDFYMSDSIELNEAYAAISWPMMLSIYESEFASNVDYKSIYADYRELFAKEGNFKTAINEPLPFSSESEFIEEYPLFFIDHFLMFSGNEGRASKFVQYGMVDAYELPACNLKQEPVYETQVTGGLVKYFKCDGRKELWIPIMTFGREIDAIASSIAGECNDSLTGKFVMIDSMGTSIVAECNGKYWTRTYDLKSALCKGKQEGSYVSGVGGRGYTQYFRCVADTAGNIVGDSVSYYEYAIGEQCNAKAKDTLYTISNQDGFFICDTLRKSFVPVDSSSIDTLARIQLGKCDTAKANEVGTIRVTPRQQRFVVCELNGNGFGSWRHAAPTEVKFGVCTDSLMETSATYKIDEYEWNSSTMTGKEHYKCDCDYVWEETADGEATVSIRSYKDCRWTVADDLDLKLKKACNSSIIDTVASSGNDDYICNEGFDSSSSTAYRSWEQVNPNRACPGIVAPRGGTPWLDEPCDYPCAYVGKTYYYSLKRGEWITLGKDETCMPIRGENDDEGDDSYCASANDNSLFFVKDSVHIDEVMVAFPNSSGSRTCENGVTVCENQANRFYTYKGSYAVLSENEDFFTFADGASMNGFALPEYYVVEYSDNQQKTCRRVSDVQEVCTAQNRLFVEEYGESSCEHPCVYGGVKYYYNFNQKVNDSTYGKWMTLAEMGMTECPAVEDYCDDHNSLGVSCSTYGGCFDFQEQECQFEDGSPCDCYDEDDAENGCESVKVEQPSYCAEESLTCSYPFTRIEVTCEMESGTWQTQN